MGRMKHDEMDRQDRIAAAIEMCIEIGAIERCENHEDALIDQEVFTDSEELTQEILKQNPEALVSFQSRDDMVDCVGEALAAAGECYTCEKNRHS